MKSIVAALCGVMLGIGIAAAATESTRESVYIAMPDGTRLAADIYLPSAANNNRLTTLVSFTRYWRSRAFDPPAEDPNAVAQILNRAGYAAVIVDTRGSGASFGTRAAEFSPCETRDFRSVIDWVAAQTWSNGRVGTLGISYSGNTAEHATADPSPALFAAVPRFTDFDAYASILFPGGLRNSIIAETWGAAVHALDNNDVPSGEWRSAGKEGTRLLGVRPVDADPNRTLLAQAVAEHARNQNVTEAFARVNFRDELQLTGDPAGPCNAIVSPYLLSAASHSIPAFHWGSWMDAGTAAGVIARFAKDPSHGQYIIGPWTHGASFDADVFKPEGEPVSPSLEEQYKQIFAFLSAGRPRAGLSYFTMGAGIWKHTDRWPVAGTTDQRWYLAPGNTLRRESSASSKGHDKYAVNYSAGSGQKTRWSTQLGGTDVFYGDRRKADELLLTYTSAPLVEDTEITGHPVVQLYLSSTHDDGAVIAYLEAVDPAGRVLMITEGHLRLIHRKISPEAPPYPVFGPYHSFERKDALPLKPGSVVEVGFALLPTSVRVPKGYRLRLAIAGHDRDTFSRYPSQGTPTLTVQRNLLHASSLVLPVVSCVHSPAC